MLKLQNELLKNWHLKLLLLSGLMMPTITATGAYYDLRGKITSVESRSGERMTHLELQMNQQFADKDTLKELQGETRQMHDDIIAIKTLLTRKLK